MIMTNVIFSLFLPNFNQFGGTIPCQLFFPDWQDQSQWVNELFQRAKGRGWRDCFDPVKVWRPPMLCLPHICMHQANTWPRCLGSRIFLLSVCTLKHAQAMVVSMNSLRRRNKSHVTHGVAKNLWQIGHHNVSPEWPCFSFAQAGLTCKCSILHELQTTLWQQKDSLQSSQ